MERNSTRAPPGVAFLGEKQRVCAEHAATWLAGPPRVGRGLENIPSRSASRSGAIRSSGARRRRSPGAANAAVHGHSCSCASTSRAALRRDQRYGRVAGHHANYAGLGAGKPDHGAEGSSSSFSGSCPSARRCEFRTARARLADRFTRRAGGFEGVYAGRLMDCSVARHHSSPARKFRVGEILHGPQRAKAGRQAAGRRRAQAGLAGAKPGPTSTVRMRLAWLQ